MPGYTLKLNVYVVSLIDSSDRTKSVTYKDYHESLAGPNKSKPELFDIFKDKFLDSFLNRFQLNYNSTKGIAIKQINSIPNKNIIDGMLVGGLTGVEQDVYRASNSSVNENTILPDQLTALPYYFKIWMPHNSDTGVIMIQSYTETGVVSLALEKIKHFFRSNNYTLASTPFVDNEYKEKFKSKSTVDKLILTKTHLSSSARGALNQLFSAFDGLKIEIKISGFNVNIDDFWNKVDAEKPLETDLSEFEMDKKENYDVTAIYRDAEGRQSQAKLSRSLNILPTIILNSDLKEAGKEYPNYDKIRTHTDAILNKVKIEIGYAAQDMG